MSGCYWITCPFEAFHSLDICFKMKYKLSSLQYFTFSHIHSAYSIVCFCTNICLKKKKVFLAY